MHESGTATRTTFGSAPDQHVRRVVPQRLGVGVAQVAAGQPDVGQHVVVEAGQRRGGTAIFDRAANLAGTPGHSCQPQRPTGFRRRPSRTRKN